MHVVILCDSKFGNTQHLAEAMQNALRTSHQVELRTPEDGMPDRGAVDVLLVGGPTHAHGASQPLKTALSALPKGSLAGARTATFDTRFDMARILTGSAAGSATKLLKHAGATMVAPPQSFFVSRDDPPVLAAGELERAAAWAREVVEAAG
jgi:flavodoxin